MATNSKKKRTTTKGASSAAPRSYSELYKNESVLPAEQVVGRAGVAAPAVAVEKTVDWAHDYAYVFRDLRHLSIVSIALLAIMLVIGFFL